MRALGFVCRLACLALLVGYLGLGFSATAWATLYRCTDSSGTEVYTDSPVQLMGCTPIRSDQLVPGSRSSPRFTTPNTLRSPRGSPRPRSRAPISRRGSLSPLPDEGDEDEVDQELAREREPAPSEKKSPTECASPVNPLNPFQTVPCPPSEGAEAK